MITSQPTLAEPPPLAVAAANALTLGVSGALHRRTEAEEETSRREHLEDLRLPDDQRELLHRAIHAAIGGSVENVDVRSEISAPVQIQYTLARTPARDIVLLDVPAAILADARRVRRLIELTYVLRGKTVRIFSRDLRGTPASALNGLRALWEKDEIDAEYVPSSHLEELSRGEADLGNVLKLDLTALANAPAPPDTASGSDEAQSRQAGKPRRLRIFLASSDELSEERRDFTLYFQDANRELFDRGIFLEVVRWENFYDAVSKTRKQDEYNAAIRECDIFVCLLATKVGTYTREEFETAYEHFSQHERPEIFTFFKKIKFDTVLLTPDAAGQSRLRDLNSLLEFKAKLGDLGHFYNDYESTADLELQFGNQLNKFLSR